MALTDEQLSFYAAYIEKNLGIVYKPDNYYQLSNRLDQVSVQLGFDDVSQMHEKLQSGIFGHAKTLILDIATNNETLFFRDRTIFSGFKEFLETENEFSQAPFNELKIWCAACSTGQEPYSLSFLLSEWKKIDPRRKYSILATDFSTRVLEYAQKAQYTQLEVQRGLKVKELVKYLEPADDIGDNDVWRIKNEYRNHIKFDQLNLLSAWPHLEKFDFVFVRNVLIYFDVETKSKIIEKIHTKLNEGGLLALGSSESLVGISNSFENVKIGGTGLYRKLSK